MIFLRGDFNVSHANHARTGMLEFFCSNQALDSLYIQHPTYHHFVGSASSHLDKILFSQHVSSPERLTAIHCKLDHPLVDSHHDILVSTVNLPHKKIHQGTSVGNIIAPRTKNKRTKTVWTEAGIPDYRESVIPLLKSIQDLCLANPKPSRSIMSLALQCNNRVLTEIAYSTNKTKVSS